jgi:phage terminase small subunit
MKKLIRSLIRNKQHASETTVPRLVRCSICSMPTDERKAVDELLSSASISLSAIAKQLGIAKASVWRHQQHAKNAAPKAESPAIKPEVLDVTHQAVDEVTPEKTDGLSPKQEQFCREYMVDLNGTQAAIRAGYSPKTANEQAAALLAKPSIKSRISELQEVREKRTCITADRVLKEYAKLAFFDPRKLFDEDGNPVRITELDDETAAAVAGFEVNTVLLKDEVAEQEAVGSGISRKDACSTIRKYKIADKKGALDSIGRHLGMFHENQRPPDTAQPMVVFVMPPERMVDASGKMIEANAQRVLDPKGQQ